MEKKDYIQKAEELLNTDTYKKITEDPTNKHKNRLVNILKNINSQRGLNVETYRRLYPKGAVSPNFMGCQRFTSQAFL